MVLVRLNLALLDLIWFLGVRLVFKLLFRFLTYIMITLTFNLYILTYQYRARALRIVYACKLPETALGIILQWICKICDGGTVQIEDTVDACILWVVENVVFVSCQRGCIGWLRSELCPWHEVHTIRIAGFDEIAPIADYVLAESALDLRVVVDGRTQLVKCSQRLLL